MPLVHEAPLVRTTLRRRLARTLVLFSVLAATLATGTALGLADVWLVGHLEQSGADAAVVLAAELDENPALMVDIEAEARELGIAHPVAVTRRGEVVSGSETLPMALERACGRSPGGGLVCQKAMKTDPAVRVFTSIPAERLFGHRGPFAWAGLAVVSSVLVIVSLVGDALAMRVLMPLEQLRAAVVDVDASSPRAVHLPPQTGLQELDALRSALMNLLERLEGELIRARRFAANAAHELRTPLTKISMDLELSLEARDLDRATLQRLQKTTDQLRRLTERLLLLATPQDAFDLTQATSMSALVEALPERRPPADTARLHIDASCGDGLVRGDPVLLTAVLDNAVDNALKFSSGPVSITLREAAENGRVLVDVEDHGPGVPEDRLEELFEPFTRASNVNQPGAGLGLALGAHITRAFGGRIAFVRGRKHGACLRIDLPAVPHPTDPP